MPDAHNRLLKRHELLAGAVTGAGLLALGEAWHCGPEALRWGLRLAAGAEPPPETRTIRLPRVNTICVVPQYVAEDFLPAEGFSTVKYVQLGSGASVPNAFSSGEVDIGMFFSAPLFARVDLGDPIVLFAGVHIGCFDLFGTGSVRRISDLKGKTVAVTALGNADHFFLSSMLSYVGLNPRTDVNWVLYPSNLRSAEAARMFAEQRVDALMTFPPLGQELRARKVGHVVVDSAMDRPWSQYFCCMVAVNREFYRRNPVATKRALRAILKAADVVASDPERTARFLVTKRYTARYDYALQALKHLPYNQWRNVDPEDTVRFYSLRLHEVGMLRNTPQKIISRGTDWRLLKELKRELKAGGTRPGGQPNAHHGG